MGATSDAATAARLRGPLDGVGAQEREQLERTISVLEATIESTADGILVVDRAGQVVAYNERFATLWRIPRELVARGADVDMLAFVVDQLCDPAEFLRGVERLYEAAEEESLDVVQFCDGRVFERYSRPQRIDDQIVGRVWSFRDVTERERLLREAQDEVRAREEFLAVASHEIRGPIATIRLAVDALREGLAPAARLVDIIEREEHRLERLAEELLDLGRIQAGKLHLARESVDLAAIVREVAARLANRLEAADSPLTIDAPGHAPGTFAGTWDRFRVTQVVLNLLSNAIKFGSGHPIEIALSAHPERILLTVTDHGIGIPPGLQQTIFDPFERAVPDRHYGGLGLGLYIVRRIVEDHGGTITVHSAPGEGATFRVEMPRGPHEPREAPP